MSDDTAKRAILARRARFIAAAIASTGLTGCDKTVASPGANVAASSDQGPNPTPRVCLTVMPPERLPPAADPGAEDAGAPPPRPTVCLKIRAPG